MECMLACDRSECVENVETQAGTTSALAGLRDLSPASGRTGGFVLESIIPVSLGSDPYLTQ